MKTILLVFLIVFVSAQTEPSFPNPVRIGTTSITFTYANSFTLQEICYANTDATKAVIGDCALNSENAKQVICSNLAISTDTPLWSCDKSTPDANNSPLGQTLMFRAQTVKSVGPREILKNVESPVTITMEVEVNDIDLNLFAYQNISGTRANFISCIKSAKIATCRANIAIEGIYFVVYNNVPSQWTFKVDDDLDDNDMNDNLDDNDKGEYLVISLTILLILLF